MTERPFVQKLLAYSEGLTGRVAALLGQAAELAIRGGQECITVEVLDQAAQAKLFQSEIEPSETTT